MSDEAIPAATLILVRERPRRSARAADGRARRRDGVRRGRLVFPGGRIDEADRELAAELGVEAAAVAAIRETIEETAVPVGLSPLPDAASLALDLQERWSPIGRSPSC